MTAVHGCLPMMASNMDPFASHHLQTHSRSPSLGSYVGDEMFPFRHMPNNANVGINNNNVQTHSRHSSNASSQSTYSTDLISPADSPPNHNIANPALKSALPLRSSHMRARNAALPYPRDPESVYSSSSETEDMNIYFNPSPPDFNAMFPHQSHHHLQHPAAHDPHTLHAAGQFGRMTINPDQALEQLAANVRAATTTSASDRAKQIFVQAWLNANYAPYPDGNVPRQGLYFSYRRVCDQYGIPHINTATLGKAIRLCFPTIKTRRLGVRGNSKYHYCGIRPVTTTEIDWLQDYVRKSNNANQANGAQRPLSAGQGAKGDEQSEEDDEDEGDGSISNAQGSTAAAKRNSLTITNNGVKNPMHMDTDKTPTTTSLLAQAQQHRPNYPGQAPIRRRTDGTISHSPPLHNPHGTTLNGTTAAPTVPGSFVPGVPPSAPSGSPAPVSVRDLPNFPRIDEAVGDASTASSPQSVVAREVWHWFEDHLDSLLESVRSYRFDQFELHLRTFWTSLNGDHREVVHAPAVAGLMGRADAIVYDEILEILRSQMLSPISPTVLNNLRQMADKMEKILIVALENYGNTFVEPKVELGARFGHLVLRFLDIFQVTQALSTVLSNPKQLTDMRRSWSNIDFESVRNQSALVCNCRHEDLLQLLEVDFVALLTSLTKSSEPVKEVMAWADSCCDRLMVSNRNGGNVGAMGEDRSTMSPRSVLIRWGYVTSQIMRDLTIRSDPAFGAFQILKLFLDDWIALNVLRNVALSTNSVAASVEPVIQQQFFGLSPMAGQEDHFGASLDVRGVPSSMMSHTPTTTSMLAALHDFGNGGVGGALGDPSSNVPFNSDGFPSMYLDTHVVSSAHDDGIVNGMGGMNGISGAGPMFGDYTTGGAFDVSAFGHADLSVSSAGAAHNPGDISRPDSTGIPPSSASVSSASSVDQRPTPERQEEILPKDELIS